MNQGFAKPGAFRVLLWKEWRQQRWTAAGLTALALGLFVAGGFIARWSFSLSGAAYAIALLGVPLVLGARAFAGEDEDGTAIFLRELPFRPLPVFVAKFLVVVLASWAAAGLLSLLGRRWQMYPDNAMESVLWVAHVRTKRGTGPELAGIWLLAPTATCLASLLASLGLRSLTTALLTGVGLCPCIGLGAVSVRSMHVLQVDEFVWAVAAVTVPASGAVLAAWLSARRHPRKLVQFVRGAGGCIGVMALFLLPAALPRFYLVAVATPEAYWRPIWWRPYPGRVTVVAPPVERPAAVTLACGLYRGRGAALALLDAETGRTVWLDSDLRPPEGASEAAWQGLWSPDGSRVAWQGTGHSGIAAIMKQKEALCVYDLKTEQTIRIHGRVPVISFMLGTQDVANRNPWYDNTWIAGVMYTREGGLGVGFVDTEDGSVHACPVPSVTTAAAWKGWIGTVVVPGRAVFTAMRRPAAEGGSEELVIARCTPSAAEATLLRVRHPPAPPACLRAVTSDARWALFVTPPERGRAGGQDLVDLDTGATRPVVLPPEGADLLARIGPSLQVVGFVAGGTRLLVAAPDALGLYDPERDSWQVVFPPVPDGHLEHGKVWEASPDGERFLQRCYAPAGARIFDVGRGQWTMLPLKDGYLQWYGNQHVLGQSNGAIWRLGLDGSREVLWPRE
jgi:hypothetical protein